MKKRNSQKKTSCLANILLLPFYMTYFTLVICGSFLISIYTFISELIKLPFAKRKPMTGLEYEKYVASYLKRKGYWGVKVTQASADYGIDVTARKGSSKYAVQCKYYSSPVGISAVQEAYAGMKHYNCNKAMVVTNSTFTHAAEVLAKENGVILLSNIK